MNTLRNKYHDLGSIINSLMMNLGYLKNQVSTRKSSVSDEALLKELLDGLSTGEERLLELDRELSKIKTVTYRFVDPDKSMTEFQEIIQDDNKKVQLLVIEDDEDVCMILRKMYEKRGYVVSTATTLEDGRKLLLECSPQIVLLDLFLSKEMNGIEILRLIRKERPLTKCIVITCEDNKENLVEVESLRPEAILVKPVRPDQIDAKISGLLLKRN